MIEFCKYFAEDSIFHKNLSLAEIYLLVVEAYLSLIEISSLFDINLLLKKKHIYMNYCN